MVRGRTYSPEKKAYEYGNLPRNETLSFFPWSLIETITFTISCTGGYLGVTIGNNIVRYTMASYEL